LQKTIIMLYNIHMRRFLVNKKNFNNNKVVIDGIEHNHLKNVLRLNEGEQVVVVCNDEYDYICEIEKITKGDTTLRVVDKVINNYNPKINVTVFQALTKHDNMSLIVQKLTELGISDFVPFESKFITSKDKGNKQDKLQIISNQSIKQCKRSKAMNVHKTLLFNELIAEITNYDVVIFANETETTQNLENIKLSRDMRVAIIIGSEGGFSEEECNKISSTGAKSISLGKRILRAETASIALASVIMYCMGEWNYEI